MSIIYDALKKVESSTSKENGRGQISSLPRKLPRHNFKAPIFYLSAACLGIIFINALFQILNRPGKSAKEQSPNPQTAQEFKIDSTPPQPPVFALSPTSFPAFAKEEAGQKQEEPQQASFVLNGIFFSQNEGYALINNQIVKAGDSIAGAVVKQIDLEEVELSSNGLTFRLSTRKRQY